MVIELWSVVLTLDYAAVKGALGFAYDIMYNPERDEEFCIFSRS